MNNNKLEYLKQRLEESTYDLYETVTSMRKITIAKIIDYVTFLSGLALFAGYTIQNQIIPNVFVFVSIMLFIAMYIMIKALLRGQTVGYLLMGIRFVNVRTKEPVSFKEYMNYIKKTTKLEVRYTEIFRYYLNYDGRLNQNQPMKRFGMVLVDASEYKRFYQDYQSHLNRYEQLQNNPA